MRNRIGLSFMALSFAAQAAPALGQELTKPIEKEEASIAPPASVDPKAVEGAIKESKESKESKAPPAQVALVENDLATSEIQENTTLTAQSGQPIEVESLGIRITPFPGWEVRENSQGMSLILEAPKSNEIVYDKVTYRPNITVVASHEPVPMDEASANELKARLKGMIEKGAGISQVDVDSQHRFFNYKGENDGLIIYSSFQLGESLMRQMNVVVSGNEKHFLLTYTDLAEEFEKTEAFNKAWDMIASIEVTGEPPHRFANLIIPAIAGLFFLLGLMGVILLRRRGSKFSEADLDQDGDDEVWADAKSFEAEPLYKAQSDEWPLSATQPSNRL